MSKKVIAIMMLRCAYDCISSCDLSDDENIYLFLDQFLYSML